MANYTPEEIAAFNRKDLLNSRMSAAKATSINFEGKAVNEEMFLAFSDKVFAWIRQDQLDEQPMPETKQEILPTPTPDQQKVLENIYMKLAWTGGDTWNVLKEKVLQFSTDVAGCKTATYPVSLDSVDKIVNWLKEN